jgi:hypothetical protein
MNAKKIFVVGSLLVAFLTMGIIGLMASPASASIQIISYPTSVVSHTNYYSGSVTNWNNIYGPIDSAYAVIYGGNANDGGSIVCNTATFSSGATIKVQAFSAYGYSSHVHVYVSYNNNNDWHEVGIGGQTITSGPDLYNFGYTTYSFRYIAIAGVDDNGYSCNVNIDAIEIIT